jgi:hypothetical protein
MSFASGSRAGVAGAGVVAVGRVARCWGTIRAESVEGDSKVKRSKKTSKLRFTDNSIMLEIDVCREEKVILPAENCTGKEI